MALELNIGGEVEEKIIQNVTTQKTRVNGVYFDLNNTRVFASISYGNDGVDGFEEKRIETWAIQKEYYYNLISGNTDKGTIAEELLKKVSETVVDILTTINKKEELISSKQLFIFDGDLFGFFKNIIPEEEITS